MLFSSDSNGKTRSLTIPFSNFAVFIRPGEGFNYRKFLQEPLLSCSYRFPVGLPTRKGMNISCVNIACRWHTGRRCKTWKYSLHTWFLFEVWNHGMLNPSTSHKPGRWRGRPNCKMTNECKRHESANTCPTGITTFSEYFWCAWNTRTKG